MRKVPLTLTDADKKRMMLALQHEALGLPDPLAAVRDAGFSIERSGDSMSRFRINFQGRMIACYHGLKSFNNGNDLDVENFVPQSADAGLTRIVHNVRDTAKAVDKLFKADKRHVETFKAACAHAGPESFTPWTSESIFLTTVASTRREEPIQVRYHGTSTASVSYVSQITPDNTIQCMNAIKLEDGQLVPNDHTPAEAVLRGLESRGRVMYQSVIDRICVRADDVTLTDDQMSHWQGLRSVTISTPEVDIAMSGRHAEVSKDGVPILRISSRPVYQSQTYVFTSVDGGLSEDMRKGLINLVADEIKKHPSLTAERKPVATPAAIGEATARALLEADFDHA